VPLSASAVAAVKAAIFMGDPRYIHGLSYEVGTCSAGGVCYSVTSSDMPIKSLASQYR
jgi:acetylxylan esterase